MAPRPMYPKGHPKACAGYGYTWPNYKADHDKYWDEFTKSRGYEVTSPFARLDFLGGVEPLLDGEMDDIERTDLAKFAITQHNKDLPVEEHHNLVRVVWVTVLRASYYNYYFTMTVKDSTGNEYPCRANITTCSKGCNFLAEYGLGPFVDGMPICMNPFPIQAEEEMLLMNSFLKNGDEYIEEDSDVVMEEGQEIHGRMTVYKSQSQGCGHYFW